MSKKTLLSEMEKEVKSAIPDRWFNVRVNRETHLIDGIQLDGTFTANDLDNLALILDDYQGKDAYVEVD